MQKAKRKIVKADTATTTPAAKAAATDKPAKAASKRAVAPAVNGYSAGNITRTASTVAADRTHYGAASSRDEAGRMLASATGKISQLNDLRAYVERFDKNGTTYYRARFIGFGGEREATDMCGQLKKAKMNCLAMQS